MAKKIPGELAYWLRRASTGELRRAWADEIDKPSLLTRWRLVMAIDEELCKRSFVRADQK